MTNKLLRSPQPLKMRLKPPLQLIFPLLYEKNARANAGVPTPLYGYEHDISNYVSYASLSPAYRAFVTSLQSVVIPKDWKEANHDPKWQEAMLEELRALEKNKTWDFVKLPPGKKAVSCK
jgi:hypothetical protein